MATNEIIITCFIVDILIFLIIGVFVYIVCVIKETINYKNNDDKYIDSIRDIADYLLYLCNEKKDNETKMKKKRK